jgi:hypothetical protein
MSEKSARAKAAKAGKGACCVHTWAYPRFIQRTKPARNGFSPNCRSRKTFSRRALSGPIQCWKGSLEKVSIGV